MDLNLRYDSIHNNGMQVLHSGSFPLWYGLPVAQCGNPFVAVIPVIDMSIWNFLDQIGRSADRHQVQLFLAVRDFPLHITLVLDAETRVKRFPKYTIVADGLVGQSWEFEHFALGPNAIIGSTTAPPLVQSVRDEIEARLRKIGFEDAKAPDIFHSTIYRIMGYDGLDALMDFTADMLALREKIKQNPLRLTAKRVAWDLVGNLLEPR